jgi:hypothetical protein
MSLGAATPLLPLCGRAVPFCGSFRNPEQYLFFWTLWLLPVVADALESFSGAVFGRRRFWLLLPAAAALVAILLGVYPRILAGMVAPLISGRLLSPTSEALRLVTGLIRDNLLILSLLTVLAGAVFSLPSRSRLYFVGGVFFLDLLFLGRGDLISASWAKVRLPVVRSGAAGTAAGLKYLSKADVEPYRDLQTYWNQYAVRSPLAASRVTERELETFAVFRSIASSLPVNLNLLSRLPSPDGYGSLVLSNYAAWLGDSGAINSVDASLLLQDTPEARAKREALSLAYLIGAGGRFEVIDKEQPLVGKSRSSARRVPWYPGWRAYVDGEAMAVSQNGSIFQTVEAPPGREIRFVFSPLSFKLGSVVSMMSGAAAAWLWRFWQ